MTSADTIVGEYDLIFDPGDPSNNSLYLCEPLSGESGIDSDDVITEMVTAELWSAEEPKHVPDELRPAYGEQLELVEAVEYAEASGGFLIARFDHPDYPSDEVRWEAWKQFFDNHYTRAE